MVLMTGQVKAFFEKPTQIAMSIGTRTQLQSEGMSSPGNLVDCDKDYISSISDNLTRLGGRIPDPNPKADIGATITSSPFMFGTKRQIIFSATCDLVR